MPYGVLRSSTSKSNLQCDKYTSGSHTNVNKLVGNNRAKVSRGISSLSQSLPVDFMPQDVCEELQSSPILMSSKRQRKSIYETMRSECKSRTSFEHQCASPFWSCNSDSNAPIPSSSFLEDSPKIHSSPVLRNHRKRSQLLRVKEATPTRKKKDKVNLLESSKGVLVPSSAAYSSFSEEVESPTSSFKKRDDSLLDYVDFNEIDSLCSSVASTPEHRTASAEKKTTPLSGERKNYDLRRTPSRTRLLDRCKNIALKKVYSVNSSIDQTKDTEISQLDIHNSQNFTHDSNNCKIRNFNSVSYGQNIVSKSICTKNANNCTQKSTSFDKDQTCASIADSPDLFEESFGCSPDLPLKTLSASNESTIVRKIESNKSTSHQGSQCTRIVKLDSLLKDVGDSSPNEIRKKDSQLIQKNTAVTGDSLRDPALQESQGCLVSIDSQQSLTSTLDSQPLIGRLQSRLQNVTQAKISVPIKSEAERRSEAVAAAHEAALKSHQLQEEFQLGPFFGLPSKVADVFRIHRGISDLYGWQKECIKEGLGMQNLLFSMPTSGGKTLVAEVLMLRQLLLKNRNCLLVLPYVALVQEKVRNLALFGVELDFLIEEYAGSRGSFPPKFRRKKRTLYVATIEKASGLINSLMEENRIEELGMVAVDEVHMVSEQGGRGAILENVITKLRYAARVQVVAMSATVGNLKEIASFLDAKLFTGSFRPVKLTEYVKIEKTIWEVNPKAQTEEDLLLNQHLCCFPYSKEQKQLDVDEIGGLVGEVIPDHSCLVFCATRHNCETLSLLLCKVLPRELSQTKLKDKYSLYRALVEDGGGSVCSTLRKTIPFGIAYHHSGLTEGERHLLEEAYLSGTLCCLCCTSTLSAGVNLPARRVIIRAPYTGKEFLSRARYKQMVGRAGRAGLDLYGESFLVLQAQDLKQAGVLLLSPVELCRSTLTQQDHHGLTALVFSSIGLGVASSLPALKKLASKSLLALQRSVFNMDIEAKVVEIVESLRQKGLVFQKHKHEIELANKNVSKDVDSPAPDVSPSLPKTGSCSSVVSPCSVTASRSVNFTQALNDEDVLAVSRLGQAAVKGNVDLNMAGQLYKDLLMARDNLAVNSHLHLMYLVVPYDTVGSITIIPDVYYNAYVGLGEDEQKVAKLLSISEGVIVRLTLGHKNKKVKETILKRFYVALILHHLWTGKGVWEVAEFFHLHRGYVQQILSNASAFASCVFHFCQELEELWAFRDLLANFTRQLSGCCSSELLPLLDLPAVKKGRAKMIYQAGYRTLQDIAKAEPAALVRDVEHLPHHTARQIINSAKMILIEKAESLQGEADEVLMGLD